MKLNNKITDADPKKPHSSEMVVKIKSVSCSGTNFPLVWVPFKNPLPKNPPDPIAIFDWLIL